jgi:N-acetylglucosaminyldiphosphoundecaprenol N-acetyl-beta-D-mannosaminyltransferase
VRVLGVPITPYTTEQVLERIDGFVAARRPSFFVTANLNYAMLCASDPKLREVNERAAFVVADGSPLLWWARLIGRPLPERVTGSDLIDPICERAARRGYRVYLFGAGPGVADEAAAELVRRHPGLEVVGTDSPPFGPPTDEEHEAQMARIRAAAPDIVFVSFSQPKGDLWIAEHLDVLGVPLMVQVGASFDFVAGRVTRAPRWMQRLGFEWLYRMLREPRRLGGRYLRNAWFLGRALLTGQFVKERAGRS